MLEPKLSNATWLHDPDFLLVLDGMEACLAAVPLGLPLFVSMMEKAALGIAASQNVYAEAQLDGHDLPGQPEPVLTMQAETHVRAVLADLIAKMRLSTQVSCLQ